ncbi:lysophospholipid acyltransferase family protein [Alisedimentitalea sp. MJ-SS2]|uniref:lysophospholipid acyltransferase family protein n=1 Tax=Aliisedimentitalea sp. MJ-SS2 TaxID=3049795 RepID=UPI0029120A4A|nr:lysophospholipid acyltransferase family protein [Alisedimentitalea sp. MJ-SS2]MDU8929294.1 lysophospholipid acyltransferase family protein [Alisedimentitalea sp. MJ-SS2]
MSSNAQPRGFKDRLQFGFIRAVLWLMRRLPYKRRVAFSGWVLSRVVAPLVGWRKRIAANIQLVAPETTDAEIHRIQRAVPDNFGRTLAELFSPEEFVARARQVTLEGPGLAALEQARAEGRPSILVSGHFGNYDVVRAGVIAHGFEVGGIYRPMNIPQFNEIYVDSISRVGKPLFSRGRRGMAEMMRFLKGGGTLAVLIDQRLNNGVPLRFFGHTAYTALSFAELAMKYNATVVPCYGIRQEDGISFRAVLEAPVPHTTPEDMTQALNDSLEAMVRQHMGQWFWIHNRWKDIPQIQEATS